MLIYLSSISRSHMISLMKILKSWNLKPTWTWSILKPRMGIPPGGRVSTILPWLYAVPGLCNALHMAHMVPIYGCVGKWLGNSLVKMRPVVICMRVSTRTRCRLVCHQGLLSPPNSVTRCSSKWRTSRQAAPRNDQTQKHMTGCLVTLPVTLPVTLVGHTLSQLVRDTFTSTLPL